MENEEIAAILKRMLGDHAFNNNLKIHPDFKNLVGAVDYLVVQLKITGRWCDEEGNDHINTVIKNTIEILSTPKIQ